MSKLDILEIHNNYSDVYDGYKLIGSYSLYIPFYKFEGVYEYLKETRLSVVEQYICRCIDCGINEIKDIAFVLSLDEDIMEYYIKQLDALDYIVINDSKLALTEEAKTLYTQLLKKVSDKENCDIYFDTLKGTYLMETKDDNLNHAYKKFDEANRDNNSIILEPRIVMNSTEVHLENIKSSVLNNGFDIKTIKNIKLMESRELVYHKMYLLLFKMNEKYKILCYDNCGQSGVDNSITDIIQNLYEENELHEILKENTKLDGILFNDILSKYEKELELAETEETREIIEDIKNSLEEENSLQYIMNFEIRKRFLDYLDNANESLYIISPWMNNYIIDNDFTFKLESLLKNNVKIRIIYGISSKDETQQDFRNKNTDSIANKLKDMYKTYGDLFKIKHGQTHEKLVICDRKYYINGSFNFLSYSGEDNGKFRNEGSTYSENTGLINQTIKLRFNE